MIVRYVLVLGFLSCLGACADSPTVLDPQVAARLHSIAVESVRDPRWGYTLQSDKGSDSISMAIIAGTPMDRAAIAEDEEVTRHRKDFVAAMNEENLKIELDLQAPLKKALAAAGYDTSTADLAVDKLDKIDLGRSRELNVDAVLYLLVSGGYGTIAGKEGFTPWVFVALRHYDAKSKDLLLLHSYSCNADDTPPVRKIGNTGVTVTNLSAVLGTRIPAPAGYEFASYKEILADPDRAAEGLKACAPLLAAPIAKAVSPNLAAAPTARP